MKSFYNYLCVGCNYKTPYCVRCNKVVNVLLNGDFYKCASCRVLVKITSTELVTNEEDKLKIDPSYLFRNEFADIKTSSYKKLFQSDNYLSFNQFIPGNSVQSKETFFQTPKNIKTERSIYLTTDEDIFRTSSNNIPKGYFFNLENLRSVKKINSGFYTPRGVSNFNSSQVFEELPIKDFESKLNLPQSNYSMFMNSNCNNRTGRVIKTVVKNPNESKGN
jgi:hypothetical protein